MSEKVFCVFDEQICDWPDHKNYRIKSKSLEQLKNIKKVEKNHPAKVGSPLCDNCSKLQIMILKDIGEKENPPPKKMKKNFLGVGFSFILDTGNL